MKLIFSKSSRSGMAFVWIVLAVSIMFSAIAVGTVLLQNTSSMLESGIEYYGQTTNMAKAGLYDALGWFRRQSTQPVTVFNPQLNLPLINDTDNAITGIVRTIPIDTSASIYGYYEISRSLVADVSTQWGVAGAGTIWYIESKGVVFKQGNANLPYFKWPNQVLSYSRFGTEIRRLSIVLPSQSAICVEDPRKCTIGAQTHVYGYSKLGIAFPPVPPPPPTILASTWVPSINSGSLVTGTPSAYSQVSPYLDTPNNVFGMSESQFQSLSDYNVTAVSQLPQPLPNYKIVFFNGNATFDASHPLIGTGILYCTGNLTIAASSNSLYNGIIYVKGNYQQLAPSVINGCIIVASNAANTINIGSTTGDWSEVGYDSGVIQQVQNYVGEYRFNKGIYQIE